MNHQTLRIVDANLDRATEGLRVLEDVARFVLDSIPISRSLKDVRHSIHQAFPNISIGLLSSRNSHGDIGRVADHQKEPATNFIDTVIANARRVEQSLRVLEETSRLPESPTDTAIFEDARYSIYELEKELVSRLSRKMKLDKLSVYAIVDDEAQVSEAISHKLAAIQIDPGTMTQVDFYDFANRSRNYCAAHEILLIVGQQADIAIASNADGVSLDATSMPISVVRRLIKIDQIIGYTVKGSEEAIQAVSCGADYILCPEALKTAVSSAIKVPVISPIREGNYG